ncbi:UNVERIFIED_CONTAM: hypothetical protein PYX00_004053 [Menopon gallinae]|uniref:Crossover junction endonuclease MUS81 n=1 Tax=Menopon gallinae TaxID=328185 RepID=A0AAW2I346_9NEOP
MSESVVLKRVKRRIKKSPNPLFERWLKEWRDEAKQKGSEMQYCFGRALRSLQKYPFRLESGKECYILENFGAKLCMMLDKKLSQYKTEMEHPAEEVVSSNHNSITHEKETDQRSLSPVAEVSGEVEDNFTPIESQSKRKGCMDSPARTVKHTKESDNSKPKNCYLPAFRSGGYAILVTLHKNNREMTKAELQKEAQELCDSPFIRSTQSTSYYTAWSSMSMLVKKGLVETSGRPARFWLTEKGTETAVLLQSVSEGNTGNSTSINQEPEKSSRHSDIYPNFNLSVTMNSLVDVRSVTESCNRDKDSLGVTSKPHFEKPNLGSRKSPKKVKEVDCEKNKTSNEVKETEDTFFLLPNQFDIILYVDTKEIESKQNVQNDKIVKYLQRRNVKFEVKFLNIGDYLWVCRDLRNNQELVLPYIVERKRLDDLAQSVRDGRFHEQKFRLKQCGLANCIYLVEKYGNEATRLGLPLPSIQQAVSNTKVVDGFHVTVTNNNNESLSYLTLMTNLLTKIFKGKTLMSCKKKDLKAFNMSEEVISLMPFPEFNKDSGKMKKFTVRNMLVKQLLQLNGLSVEKAKAIVNVYPTPKSLIEALEGPHGENAIANITYGALNRSVGVTVAKSIHQLFTSPVLN